MNKYLVRVALVLALVLMPVLTGCDKDDVIQPQAVPISDFRNIRVVDLQVTDDADLDGDTTMAGALEVDADPETATPLVSGRRQSVGDLLKLVGGTTTPTVVAVVGQSGIEFNMPLDMNGNIDLDANPATAVPGLDVRRQSVGDLALFTGGTTTPTVVAAIRQAEVEFNRDLDQNARVHINPAETPAATTTPDAVIKASNAANQVFQIENSGATPVAQVNYAGNATFAGTLGVTGASTLTGALAANGGITVDSTAFTVADSTGNTTIAGTLGVSGMSTTLRKVIAKTGVSAALTAAECYWTIVSDLGDTGGITITLPAAVAGMDVLLYNKTGEDWIIDCDDADQIFDLTDAAGNKITNTTAFDYVHLVALDGAGWYTLDVHGTWTDAN